MILPFVGMNFKTVTWYQGESDVGPPGGWGNGLSFYGSAYYGCALSAMVQDWRVALKQPSLPFLLVELAAYCNEHGASTFKTWCDQPTSFLNKTDENLPAMRLAQAKVAQNLPGVFLVSAADLGSVHPAMGSIHPARKVELGARLALAVQAAATAPTVPWLPTPAPTDRMWRGPRAVTATPSAAQSDVIAVEFDAALNLDATAACPPAMLASPLGKLCCTGAGFELAVDGQYELAASATIHPGKPNTILLRPATETLMRGAPTSVRYAFADWPVCSVRNTHSSGGSTTEALPTSVFDLNICGSDRCPGVMCSKSHCPTSTVVSPGRTASSPLQQVESDPARTLAAAEGSVLSSRAELAVPTPAPPENFIPASSPSCWYTGRTHINTDGTRSFDWEGTQLWVNVQGASYVKMVSSPTSRRALRS
eukprot:SAG31_NODE_668_length_12945_cov_15.915849_3_plen_423_part_00